MREKEAEREREPRERERKQRLGRCVSINQDANYSAVRVTLFHSNEWQIGRGSEEESGERRNNGGIIRVLMRSTYSGLSHGSLFPFIPLLSRARRVNKTVVEEPRATPLQLPFKFVWRDNISQKSSKFLIQRM